MVTNLRSDHNDLRQLYGVVADGVEDVLQSVDDRDQRLHFAGWCGSSDRGRYNVYCNSPLRTRVRSAVCLGRCARLSFCAGLGRRAATAIVFRRAVTLLTEFVRTSTRCDNGGCDGRETLDKATAAAATVVQCGRGGNGDDRHTAGPVS